MMVKLEACQMWTAVRLGGVSRQEDRRAPEALCFAVPAKMVSALSGNATTNDAWDTIAAARVGSDRARKSALQKLREWDRLDFKPSEEVNDFALCLSSHVCRKKGEPLDGHKRAKMKPRKALEVRGDGEGDARGGAEEATSEGSDDDGGDR
jgi:hypothetical protein